MEQEKTDLAHNITSLRKAKKLTQGELAEILHYSDKTVSKWENGDATPDLTTLIALGDYFEISLDALCKTTLTPEEIETAQNTTNKHHRKFTRNKIIISALSMLLIWFIATVIFTEVQLLTGNFFWMAFIWALPLSSLVGMIFCCIWGHRKLIAFSISLTTWLTLTALHIQFVSLGVYNFWYIYILGAPAQIAIILWSQLEFKRK